MGNMKDSSNFQKCEKIFVSWTWTAAIITGFVVVAIITAAGVTERETKQDEAIKRFCPQLIQNDLDTIKMLLRSK
jgi:hypothetical protein